jgi:hypothetical protein
MNLLFQKTSQRFCYFGQNEKTIFLFGVGRDYEFTDEEILDFATSFNISGI